MYFFQLWAWYKMRTVVGQKILIFQKVSIHWTRTDQFHIVMYRVKLEHLGTRKRFINKKSNPVRNVFFTMLLAKTKKKVTVLFNRQDYVICDFMGTYRIPRCRWSTCKQIKWNLFYFVDSDPPVLERQTEEPPVKKSRSESPEDAT